MDAIKKQIKTILTNADFKQDQNDLFNTQIVITEIKDELKLKRGQVEQLKNDLEKANNEIFQLKRNLEKIQNFSTETNYNFNLLNTKTKNMEEEHKNIVNTYTKNKIINEKMNLENETLREQLQKIGMEKLDLSRTVTELESRLKTNIAFQNELVLKDTTMKKHLGELEDTVEQFQKDQNKILDVLKYAKMVEDSNELLNFYLKQNKDLKNKNFELEDKLVKLSAKFDKLSELMNNETCKTLMEPNLMTKLITMHCMRHTQEYKENSKMVNERLELLTSHLKEEKINNTKLILSNENYKQKIQELEDKLTKSNTVQPTELNQSKTEIIKSESLIEICDEGSSN